MAEKYISKDTWFDGDGKAFQPQVHYFVGGATNPKPPCSLPSGP
jgi:hypothetical protein